MATANLLKTCVLEKKRRSIRTFLLFALNAVLFGCGSQQAWIVQRNQATKEEFISSKLILPAKIPSDDIELEFMRTQTSIELFLIIRGQPIGNSQQHAKEIPLKVEAGSEVFTTIVYRHDGGQKFTVPIEMQTFISDCLKNDQPVTLTLPGYRQKIDPKGFASSYDRFIHTPYLQNPFVLPF